jgi:hypothetical protein
MTLPQGADYSLTESALIPFQAEPTQFPPARSKKWPASYFYAALTQKGVAVMDGETAPHRLIVVNRMALAASVQRYARIIDRGDFDRIYGIADEAYIIDTPQKLQDVFNTATGYRADLLAVDDALFSAPIRNELLKESSALSVSAECRIISSQVFESLS